MTGASMAMMERTGRRTLVAGAVLAGIGVLFGAFGAHALEGRLSADNLGTWETGVRYQIYHALALLIVGVLRRRSGSPGLKVSATLFGLGIGLFSGSLYLLVLSEARWLGAVTPLGGVAFLAGWTALAIGAWRS